MNSPYTGQPMPLKWEERTFEFRKESFQIVYHFYHCEKSGEQFVDTTLGDLNLRQVHYAYRAKHHLPFPDEIRQIRERYGLPATRMSEILGFGVNGYGSYERGEVPSLSNARIIQLAAQPEQFKRLVELADSLKEKQRAKLLKKIDQLIEEERLKQPDHVLKDYLMRDEPPSIYTGYRRPSLERTAAMTVFFAQRLQPWKTQLNKLLFYADFRMFKHSCCSISGLRYRAIQNGPVPFNYDSLFEYLVNRGYLIVTRVEFSQHQIGEQFQAAPDSLPKRNVLSDEEWEMLEQVAAEFQGMSAKAISERSHREAAWTRHQEERSLISYACAFELKG